MFHIVYNRRKAAFTAVFFLFVLLAFCLIKWIKPLPLGGNDQKRREFLLSHGIEAGEYTTETVTVPAFSAEYLAFQQAQGFCPEEYLHKQAAHYCFEIINFPTVNGKFYANLLICDDFIIAGEIFQNSSPQKIYNFAFLGENSGF